MTGYQKRMYFLIAGVALCKLILAAVLQLGNDEVYYLTYAQQLQWNYFDHPPAVAVVIDLFSLNLLLKHELFLRLGFILIGCVNTWLVYRIGKKLYNDHAGWLAALFFSASLYGTIIAGFMIMPDGPLLLFWLLGVSLAVDISRSTASSVPYRLLLWFGFVNGLAVMSKISAVSLWIGFILFLLCYKRSLFRHPGLYLALLLTACMASPAFLWNRQHDGGGMWYHAGRIALHHVTLNPSGFLRQLLGELGYNNPLCCVPALWGLYYCSRNKIMQGEVHRLLLWLLLPLLAIVWFFSFFRPVLPHWTGPSYTLLLFYGAVAFAHRYREKQPAPNILKWANVLVAAAIFFIAAASFFLPFVFNRDNKQNTGKGDLMLDFTGWKRFSGNFSILYENDQAAGTMQPGAVLLADYWFPAAHLNWYVARENGYPFKAVGRLNDIHQFAWLNRQQPVLKTGIDAYYITVSNYYRAPGPELLRCFSVGNTVALPQLRMGKSVRYFFITRLHHYKGGIKKTGVTD
ncbi:ArnT family glycosyltransferase [Niabella beijingensis]|uniref:ArnT family glycosyltransferase n=1 Tax=Niabella beijingensis TaxID=2872700 RepID=UPI001CBC6711|nr:glycosyltransferase family 39 protein [Niabella beijingensis]MBZ4189938.1 glycosyltransferase family 39 protein [Niabella beijingensis]